MAVNNYFVYDASLTIAEQLDDTDLNLELVRGPLCGWLCPNQLLDYLVQEGSASLPMKLF